MRWGSRLALFCSLDLFCRVLQMLCALVIVRTLTKDQYAWYNIATGLQSNLLQICSMGGAAALYSIGAQDLRDRNALGQLLWASQNWRIKLFMVAVFLLVPIFGWLLVRNGCSPSITITLLGLAITNFLFESKKQVLIVPLQLDSQFNFLQKTEAVTIAMRFVSLCLLIRFGLASPAYIFLVTIFLVGLFQLRIITDRARILAEDVSDCKPALFKRVRKLSIASIPTTLTSVVEGQIPSVAIGLTGRTSSVADLGALSRLSLLLALPSSLLTNVIQPRLATAPNKSALQRLWFGTICGSALVGIALMCGSYIFSEQILFVLGPKYSSVGPTLTLFAGSLALSFVATGNGLVISARGWLHRAWARPFAVIGAQLLALTFVRMDTLTGAIILGLAATIAHIVTDSVIIIQGFRGPQK